MNLYMTKKLDLKYLHVFGALCYPTNDSEDLGKLKPKVEIGSFIGYTPAKKAYRVYNRRTCQIMETIHVEFDELTAMASEQSSSGPALYEMTPGTISSGLVQNPPSTTPYVPPTKNDWNLPADPTGSPSSTSIDQDAPSTSTSLTIQETQSPDISERVEEQVQQAPFDDDPFLDILTSEPSSQESSSIMQPNNPPFDHISKWTKNHPLENVIENPSRPVST
ncbi:retrovirus-related pol polyprotein from transposon TNT 1-94 [Tanacetum coccineum]|uniref:Retrovirus-related pol polyprotein from transposon TNT 1-94 n=1 Tax=Tanacetum coccineum TaxID=301880 RepID=A0ABQ5GJL1_9ASTR